MATLVTKNSSTASATPTSGDLVQGELAVNVTDKKLYTKNSGGTVVKLVGSLGNQEASAVAITGGTVAGITDLAIADGGTGASTAADARANLGLGTAAVQDVGYFATAAQGTLADSAVQPGDNVSDLTNDAGYLTAETYTGTVTSVDMSVPTGLAVSGNPVTSSGTLAVTYASGYAIPTTVKQSNWDDSYTFVSAFPSQTGNSGKYLTTDGSTLSWSAVSVDADPAGTAVALAIALG